ncbi:MAG: ArsR/SmtB family transcription factor, partial [Candidatus Nanoarchaeia archaeon]
MTDKNFLLLSLDDDHAKQVAHILSNKSCAKILKYVTSNKATASEISKELNIPLSTVHYNLKQLLQAKLVQAKEFHYSKKGKEVLHYTVTNKYIVIAPSQDKEGFLEKLKTILPVTAMIAVGGLVVSLLSKITRPLSIAQKNIDTATISGNSADMVG